MLQVSDEKIPLRHDKSGNVFVGETRVMLDCLVEMFDLGASPEEIAAEYDSVALPDVYAVLRHQSQKLPGRPSVQPSQLACETSFFEQSVSGRLVVVKFLLDADLPKALATALRRRPLALDILRGLASANRPTRKSLSTQRATSESR